MSDSYRVRIWKRDVPDEQGVREPDEVYALDDGQNFVWQNDPRYHSPSLGLDIHPEDAPATLEVYTSDSVRSPPGYDSHVERAYWDGPMEQGLTYPEGHDNRPFGCELWSRVMFRVEDESND